MIKFVANCWQAVMDHRHNPLRHLDLASQHYMMQVLAWMWSMAFCLGFYSIFQFGVVWIAHVLILAACAFTVAVFKNAERKEGAQRIHVVTRPSRCVWDTEREA